MNYFEFLVIGHLAGDFLFQTGWMAAEKSKKFAALFVHSTVYTLFIGLASTLAGRFSLPALFVVLLSHMLLDNRKFVRFWVKKVNGAGDVEWLKIVVDQCWHLIVLGLVAHFF
ncbi:MAG: DUF3307 domain-containing protein [Peptococcaceae bacterium]|nr:DUF3307 domain-containing protein [Peptococcaceae bacterium]